MSIEEILAALQAIVDGAKSEDGEDRPLTDEEAERYEDLEGQLKAAQRSANIVARQTAYTTPTGAEMRGLYGTANPNRTEDDTLTRAFDHYMRTGRENADIQQLRAQSVGTDTAGGFTVPEVFRQKLVDRMVAFGGLAAEVETITTSTGAPMPFPTLDDTANEGEIAAEGAAGAAGADLVFGEIVLGSFKYVAPGVENGGLRVSVELLQDSAFNIESLVTRKLGQRIGRAQAADWVAGTGTGEPTGITASTGPSATFAGAAPTHGELVDALHSVDPDYRSGAVWAFNDQTLAEIRKLTDGQGRPLWAPLESSGLVDQPGGTLLGHRVVIDQAFANYTDASSNVWGVFGDLRESYVIRRVRDVQLIVDPYTRAANGQVAYTVWARADGNIQNPNAFVTLENDAA